MDSNSTPLDAGMADPDQAEQLELTEEISALWIHMSNWGLFFQILLFFATAVCLWLGWNAIEIDEEYALKMVALSAMAFVPGLLILRFRQYLKQSLFEDSAEFLENAFRMIKVLYILGGVCTILLIVYYAYVVVDTRFIHPPNPDEMPVF